MRNLYILGLIALVALIIGLAWAEEMKFSTYYPAPYGVYNQMVTRTLGVGDNDGDGNINSADAPDPNTNPDELWVAGNVGIGTTSPGAKLHVGGTAGTDGIMFPDGTIQTSAAVLPVGTIAMYAGSTVPTGWLLADGSAVSRTTYANLFAAIGTTFGAGNGSSTFNLPDFRGIFPKGAGTTNRSAGKDASGSYYAGILGTYSQDQMQGHWHNLRRDWASGSTWETKGGLPVFFGNWYGGSGATPETSTAAWATTLISDGTNGTPRTGHTTEPQSLGVNFIIKY